MQKLTQIKKIKNLHRKAHKPSFDTFLIVENVNSQKTTNEIVILALSFNVSKIYFTQNSCIPDIQFIKKRCPNVKSDNWEFHTETTELIRKKREKRSIFITIDNTDKSIDIKKLPKITKKYESVYFVIGDEIHGVSKKVLQILDIAVLIPVFGKTHELGIVNRLCAAMYGSYS